MSPTIRFAALLVTAWLAGQFTTAAIAAEKDANADEQAIIATIEAMWAALEAGDVDAYAQHMHPDYTLFGENDVYLFEGKALEVRNMSDWVARAKGVHTEMHDPRITVNGDTAWITYYWTDSGYVSAERYTSRGKSTRIFVREGKRWLCIHGHFTAVP